jgi:hypothetical protein
MKNTLWRKPSASMIVATTALVLAASGSAIAASNLVSGDKLIRKHSLSGNRLRNHTITGKQLNMSRLGTVPSAANAGYATNANTAANAYALDGQPASSFLTAGNHIGTGGLIEATGSTSGNSVTLFTVGPFTVWMTCTKTSSPNPQTSLSLYGTSSEANSIINGALVTNAGAVQDLGKTTDINGTNAYASRDDVNIDFEAPSGAAAVLVGADGVNSLGADCWANWAGIH